jgi:hypothetical protein
MQFKKQAGDLGRGHKLIHHEHQRVHRNKYDTFLAKTEFLDYSLPADHRSVQSGPNHTYPGGVAGADFFASTASFFLASIARL